MRIASYNILSGGFGSYSYEIAKPERLDLLKQAVSQLHANFVGLVDTFRWDTLYSNAQIAEMFGYRSAYCINLNDDRLKQKGHNNGITVLTNEEVIGFETINIETRDAVKTRLRVNGKLLDLYTIYLDDLSEEVRKSQVKKLLTNIDPNASSIIMGDFNAMKKQDLAILKPLIDRFFEANPNLASGYKPVIDEMMRGETISILEQGGFIDIATTTLATAPTKLFPVKIESPILRLDYAYSKGDINCLNFEVRRDGIFDSSSDHYPILFDYQIT